VECNKRYGYSAEQTLQLIQSLYEKKVTTYPRVDTTYLPTDVYPQCPLILANMTPYARFIIPLSEGGKTLEKSKKVFDNSKVTDHHAIIPTSVPVTTAFLTDMEKRVYDLIARRFIGVFYPDCRFEQTTVTGEVKAEDKEPIAFKATGKRIIDPTWHVLWDKGSSEDKDTSPSEDSPISPSGGLQGAFKKGESGPHEPTLTERQTTPPKPYTEATLLRAMETAGKMVDDEELRDALKENGIGRPSTRAAIIETLFKRQYIRRNRKSLAPTPTGIQLIGLIHEELLKSAELTGIWERKLRMIERHEYDAHTFMDELKQMVSDLVLSVMRDQ
jgi:DNA topoisomerase-3